MCLAIPMRIISIDGHQARCEAKGVRRDVSLTLIEVGDAKVGDYVLVHVGYAIQKITITDALAAWDLFDELAAALDQADA